MTDSFDLPRELTIYHVAELCDKWRTAVQALGVSPAGDLRSPQGGLLQVEAARVDEVDGAGIQLLLSLSRTLAARNGELRLVNASEPLRRACEAFGVALRLTGEQDPAEAT